MYQGLSVLCFIVILWMIFGMDFAEDNKKGSKDSDGNSLLPALLGGIIISPIIALGGFLFVLGRIALAIPAVFYGIALLCGRAFQWLREQCKNLPENLGELRDRISRNVERLLEKVGLRRTLDRVSHAFHGYASRVKEFLRKPFAGGQAGNDRRSSSPSRTKDRASSAREGGRGTFSRSSSRSRASWWLVPFRRNIEERDRREDKRRILSGNDRSTESFSRKGHATSKLFSAFFARRGDVAEQKERETLHRREAATHHVHGTRFSRAVSSVSSVFHGHVKEGKVTFKRIGHPAKSRSDIMEDLRKVGRQTRRRLKSIE